MKNQMIQKKDLDNIISSHGLSLPALRHNRQIEEIDNSVDIDAAESQNNIQLPPGMTLPTDIPEGFDLSSVEPQEDGQFCVFKKLSLEGIEKIPVQQCVHKVMIRYYYSHEINQNINN